MTKSKKLKRTLIVVFILIIVSLFVYLGVNTYLNNNKMEAIKELPTKYFSLLNENKVDEAFELVHFESNYDIVEEMMREDYHLYPPNFENVQIGEPIWVNQNLYKIDISLYHVMSEETHNLESYVLLNEKQEPQIFILNMYNIPEQYRENVLIVEDEDYISPGKIIRE